MLVSTRLGGGLLPGNPLPSSKLRSGTLRCSALCNSALFSSALFSSTLFSSTFFSSTRCSDALSGRSCGVRGVWALFAHVFGSPSLRPTRRARPGKRLR